MCSATQCPDPVFKNQEGTHLFPGHEQRSQFLNLCASGPALDHMATAMRLRCFAESSGPSMPRARQQGPANQRCFDKVGGSAADLGSRSCPGSRLQQKSPLRLTTAPTRPRPSARRTVRFPPVATRRHGSVRYPPQWTAPNRRRFPCPDCAQDQAGQRD